MKNLFRKMRRFTIVSLLLLLCLSTLYFLPREEAVFLIGTEVKREQVSWLRYSESKDVRYIVARHPDSGDTLMFRNEDIVFPPYLKFDSGDVAGRVMNFEEFHPAEKFKVMYYGWRVPVLSIYPNLTSIKFSTSESSIFEFRIVYFSSIVACLGLIILFLRKLKVWVSKIFSSPHALLNSESQRRV